MTICLSMATNTAALVAYRARLRKCSWTNRQLSCKLHQQEQQQAFVLQNTRGTRLLATLWPDLLLEESTAGGASSEDEEEQGYASCGEGEDEGVHPVKELLEGIAKLRDNQVVRIVRMIKSWTNAGNELSKEVLIYVMTRLRKRHRYAHALEISDWMYETRLFPRNERDAIFRLELASRCGAVGKAEKLFRRLGMKERDEKAHNALLLGYVVMRPPQLGRAQRLYNRLKASKMITSPYTFNLMARIYRKRKMNGKVLLLVEDAKELGITLDLCFYNNLLAALFAVEGIEAAEELFYTLAVEGNNPTFLTYVSMASCYIAAGLKPKAMGILQVMEEVMASCEFSRTRRKYNAIISLYATIKDAAGIERNWQELARTWTPKVEDYCCAMKAWGKAGNVENAEAMFKEAEANDGNLKYSPIFNAIMFVYSVHERVDKAEQLMQRMENELYVQLDQWCYHHLIYVYLKAGDTDKAEELLRRAQAACRKSKEHRFEPLPWTLWLVLDSLAEKADVPGAERVFKRWRRAGLSVHALVYNRLLKAYLRAGEAPERFIERMLEDGARPNAETEELFDELKMKLSCR